MSNNGGNSYPSDCELTGALLEKARERDIRQPVRSEAWRKALAKAGEIRLLLLDVDGVLTDGTITYTHGGGESKSFNTQDGFGLRILREGGVDIGMITARTSEAVSRRASDLKVKYVYQGNDQKYDIYEQILKASGLRPPQTAYMGDDWLDLPILARAGFSAAPANAVGEVRRRVDYVTTSGGGYGAVREICELILEAKGLLTTLLRKYS